MSNFGEEHSLACGSSPAGIGVLARSMRQLPSPSIGGSPSMRSVHVECSHTLGVVSHRSSSNEHSNVGNRIQHGRSASTFLHPLAPQALPCFYATMDALTPARRPYLPPCSGQVSLVHMTRPSMHSVTKHLTRPIVASALPAQRDRLPDSRSDGFTLSATGSGLRLESAGSSLRTAESCSSSYGLHVRLGLLPTPPRGDAVTFDYRERASPGGGLAPPCSRLLPGARIPAFAEMTPRA